MLRKAVSPVLIVTERKILERISRSGKEEYTSTIMLHTVLVFGAR